MMIPSEISLDRIGRLLVRTLLRTVRVRLSDKIEALLPRTLRRTVRVPFSTYGSNRPLSKSFRQHNFSINKIIQFRTIIG